jgi:hypothetical protein
MSKLANRLLTACVAALLFSSIVEPALSAGIVTTSPSAASKLEQQGSVVPSWALIQYLSQLQSGGAATYGSWTLATVNNAAGTTVTAGNMVGVLETRTGAAAVSDTTDTALNIIGAIPFAGIGSQALWEIQNQNTGLLTLVGGTNVTLAGQTVVPINQTWIGQINVATGNIGSATVVQQGAGYSSTAVPTVTIAGGSCSGVTATATVPPGANYVSGITITGAGSACATPSLVTCTIGAPTASGPTVQATCTANVVPTNVTITGYTTVPAASLPNTQFTALSGGTPLTLTGANMAGANSVIINLTNTLGGAGTLNSATAAQIIAAWPNAQIGESYLMRVINSSAGAFAWTLTTATGVTLTGTMSIAQNTWRDFQVTMTGAATVTIQQIGTGTTS